MLMWVKTNLEAGTSWQEMCRLATGYGVNVRAELTYNSHSSSFIPGIADGKPKMSVKVGEHGAAMTGGFNLASPISATSLSLEASWVTVSQ